MKANGVPNPSIPQIQLRGITKVYKTPAGDVTVLKNIHLDFYPGEFVGIVGKSGSGKSTLINMITGIDHPTRGSVEIGNISLHTLREGQLAVWRGLNMGVVFQFFQLLPTLTVLENTLLPMDLGNVVPPEEREGRALDLLKMVGLEDFADKLPGALAGGQQQTAAIARALANDPPILLADEPTGNLDTATADVVFSIFEKLAAQGKTIIMVTHDNSLADRTGRKIILSDGEIIHSALAAVFPHLSHPLLLQLTKAARLRAISPEGLVGFEPAADAGLVVLAGGNADVVRRSEGEPILLQAPGLAHCRPADGPMCEVLEVPQEWLAPWLDANPAAAREIENALERRNGGTV